MPSGEHTHGQARRRDTGACKGQRGANQQAGGGVRKVSQNCKPAQSPQNPLAARFSECCELLGWVVLHAPAKGKPLKAKDFFILGLLSFANTVDFPPAHAAKINPHLAYKT